MVKEVMYIGCSDEQIAFGSCDNPRNILKIGQIYEVKSLIIHSQHTKIELVGINGYFNSVCFQEM